MSETYTKDGVKYKACIYPNWEGSFFVGEHDFDEDGWCDSCGNTIEQARI